MKRMMKTVLLTVAAVALLAGCGKKEAESGYAPADALTVLTDAWNAHESEEQFFAMGGDYTNMVENAPGVVDLSLPEDVDALLGIPADAVAMADDAASLVHAMNGNVFTSSVFHVADEADVEAFISAVQENIANKQWLCGAPYQLKIATVSGQYVFVAYGEEGTLEIFKGHLTEATGAEFVVEEIITE